MLILAMVIAAVVKNAAVDTVAMATGKTPPSHAYRMAKLRAQEAEAKRRLASDPDHRGGAKMLLRHWYLDACEDVDHWRAHRHKTRPERQAAARARRRERERRIREWAAQYVPTDEDESAAEREDEDIIDAEIVDEEPEHAKTRRRSRTTTTTTTVTEEESTTRPAGDEVAVLTPDEESVKPPLPHRRMVLMTMLANSGYAPDTEAIAQMSSEEVDGAIAALVAHERATRSTAHH